MASGKFFDPLTFLKVVPLISSTVSLWFAQDQHYFLSLFTNPEIKTQADDMLPKWFEQFFFSALPRVVVPLSITATTCLVNINRSGALLREKGAFPWYVAGASLAVGHMFYVPWVAPKIDNIINQKVKGRYVEELMAWIRVNAVRTMTTDLAAWMCCVVAVVKTFD